MLSESDLSAQHKTRVKVVRAKARNGEHAWEVAFKKPTRAQYKQFKAASLDPALRIDAQDQLCQQIVVHPSPEAYLALLEEYPGIPEASTEAIQELCGLQAEDSGK